MTKRKIVVFDPGRPHGVDNHLFKSEFVKEKHAIATLYLYEACQARGIELMTPDLFYALDPKPEKAIFVRTNLLETEEDRLISMGVHPAVLFAYEFPLYACKFYWNIKKETEPYDHTFMPSGARSIVSPKTKFHSWIAPQPYLNSDHVEANFNNKNFLTMISGNTRVNILKRWYVLVRNTIKPLPTLVNRELYKDRLESIKYFSRYDDFDLYGRGWDKPVRYTFGKYDAAIKKVYRGEVPDKTATLQQYKFSLCFENAIYGGWVTEKIIDCLFAGCVPIYWGAPDITDYLPADCFIDFRNFKSYEELDRFLRAMTAEQYQKYIDAINAWIKTGFYNTVDQYVKEMIEIFEGYF